MLGTLTWIGCGVVAGYIMSHIISGYDKGIALLTIGVGISGALFGGFAAQFMGHGNTATFSFYAVLFATFGATLALLIYRRALGV